MTRDDPKAAIEAVLDRKAVSIGPMSGGCVGEVYRVRLEDGSQLAVKFDTGGGHGLDIEGFMLGYLAAHSALPVPKVLHSDPQMLAMEFLPGTSRFDRAAELHAAELLAQLHGIRADRFGFERDTLIGGLHQPNPWRESWIEFFAESRLVAMARQAHDAGRLDNHTLRRIGKFAGKVSALIREPSHPALLHGDVWTTNVLAAGGRITGFLDPAVYYGHPEIELAFITLFGTFGDAFFGRYDELRPIEPGFFEERRDIYNLYPLLVHVRLFGGGYLAGVESVLRRYGC